MTKTDLLFIRACKGEDSQKRINSVYRRFYYGGGTDDIAIVNILARICTEYELVTVIQLLDELMPNNDWKYDDCTHLMKLRKILAGYIRFATIDQFPGFISPARFRKGEEYETA